MAEEADLTGQDLRGARGKGADLRKLCLANVNLSKVQHSTLIQHTAQPPYCYLLEARMCVRANWRQLS